MYKILLSGAQLKMGGHPEQHSSVSVCPFLILQFKNRAQTCLAITVCVCLCVCMGSCQKQQTGAKGRTVKKAKTDISPSSKVHSTKCLKPNFPTPFHGKKHRKDYKIPPPPPHCCSPRWQDRVSGHSGTTEERTRMDANGEKRNKKQHRVWAQRRHQQRIVEKKTIL